MSKPKRQAKNTRGPKPGQGGRPVGPPKVKLSPMVLESTADWLRAKYPQAKTLNAAASQALDDLSGFNVTAQTQQGQARPANEVKDL